MLIAEDLLLLLYDDETGKPILGSPQLAYELAESECPAAAFR